MRFEEEMSKVEAFEMCGRGSERSMRLVRTGGASRVKNRLVTKLGLAVLLMAGLCAPMKAQTVWFVATGGVDSLANGGGSEGNPFRTIQFAIDNSDSGGEINVFPGVYFERLTMKSTSMVSLSIEGIEGAEETIIDGQKGGRVVHLGTSSAQVDDPNSLTGFTVRNGSIGGNGAGVLGGVVQDCVITNNVTSGSNDGGGVASAVSVENCLVVGNTSNRDGGGAYNCAEISNSIIQGNSARDGGGVHGGSVQDSEIIGNTASRDGGGAYNSEITSSVIAGNTAGGDGGGAYNSAVSYATVSGNNAVNGAGFYSSGGTVGSSSTYTIEFSTITNNTASADGGGVYRGLVKNCYVLDNKANNGGGAYGTAAAVPALENCLVAYNYAAVNGGGTTAGTAYNCTIVKNTIGTNGNGAGANGGTQHNAIFWYNTRLDGEDADRTAGSVSYSCFPGGTGNNNIGAFPMFVNAAAGDFRLANGSPCIDTGTNAERQGDMDLDENMRTLPFGGIVDRGCYEYAENLPVVIFVRPAPDGNDSNSGLDWDNAKATIQNAIYTVANNGLIVVTNHAGSGYAPIENALNRPIRIISVNGAEHTIIKGASGNIRPATLGTAVNQNRTRLIGFTLEGGSLAGSRDGGGVSGGTLEYCIIRNNTARDGGGAFRSILYRCELSNNIARRNGGGIHTGTLRHCFLYENLAERGGGGYSTTSSIANPTLVMENCLVLKNRATSLAGGGGMRRGTSRNCTIIYNTNNNNNNRAGVRQGNHYNAIVYFNTNRNGLPSNNGGSNYYNSHYTDQHGDPLFVNPTGDNLGDYRLTAASRCVNAGSNGYVTWSDDLALKRRIYDDTVDIGAYEYLEEVETFFYYSEGETDYMESIWQVRGDPYIFPAEPSSNVVMFVGWYELVDGVAQPPRITMDTTFTVSPPSPTNLVAVWRNPAEVLDVHFYRDANDQDPIMIRQVIGENFELPIVPPPPGYVFDGWFEFDGTIAIGNEITDQSEVLPNSPENLVAVWRKDEQEEEDTAVIALVITAIEVYKQGNADMVRIDVSSDDTSPTQRTFNISLVGAPTLTETFSTPKITTYVPQAMDRQMTLGFLKSNGCEFTLPQPAPDAFFFRAIATPVQGP